MMTSIRKPADSQWRHYRVSILGGEKGKSMELNPFIGRIEGFRTTERDVELDGERCHMVWHEDLLSGGASLQWRFLLKPPEMSLFRIEKRIVDAEGREVASTMHDYRAKVWGHPDNLAHPATLQAPLMAADLSPGHRFGVDLLVTEEAVPWRVNFVVEGTETRTVPAGTFDCYRLTLVPDYKAILGRWSWASRIIKPFVPDFHFWLMKTKPHYLVRFKGRLGPVGASSVQVHELVQVGTS